MRIGDRIKEVRTREGIMSVKLADMINVSKQTMYKYENNIVTNIPSDKIEQIAKICHTTPAYLMGWTDNSSEKEIIELSVKKTESVLRSLNSKHRDMVHQYATNLLNIEEMERKQEYLLAQAAHERTDIIQTDTDKQHDDEIMRDDEEW